jgi:hypothetical protein
VHALVWREDVSYLRDQQCVLPLGYEKNSPRVHKYAGYPVSRRTGRYIAEQSIQEVVHRVVEMSREAMYVVTACLCRATRVEYYNHGRDIAQLSRYNQTPVWCDFGHIERNHGSMREAPGSRKDLTARSQCYPANQHV